MDKITRAEVKWIKGLQARKERDTDRCLVVEGKKMVGELVELGWSFRFLVATDTEFFLTFQPFTIANAGRTKCPP